MLAFSVPFGTGTGPPIPKKLTTGTESTLFWLKISLFWSKMTLFWLFQYRSVPVPVLVTSTETSLPISVRKMASKECEFPKYLRFPAVPHLLNMFRNQKACSTVF